MEEEEDPPVKPQKRQVICFLFQRVLNMAASFTGGANGKTRTRN